MEEILKVTSLSKSFPMEKDHSITIKRLVEPKEWFRKNEEFYAVKNVSFSLREGDCIGLVGETGAGKTTTCLTIARLLEANSGQIFYKGHEISGIRPRDFANHELRPSLQMIFQDPTEALNPAYTAFKTIANPLIHLLKMKDKKAIRKRVTELADMAYFPVKLLDRYPHQLSGGEKARVGIARAFATKPDLILLDEPTSALDVSVQGGVLILLEKLRKELNITYLFVSHDLSVVRLMCTRVMIMLQGEIVEEGTVEEVFNNPKHKHTQDLIRSIPNIGRKDGSKFKKGERVRTQMR